MSGYLVGHMNIRGVALTKDRVTLTVFNQAGEMTRHLIWKSVAGKDSKAKAAQLTNIVRTYTSDISPAVEVTLYHTPSASAIQPPYQVVVKNVEGREFLEAEIEIHGP